ATDATAWHEASTAARGDAGLPKAATGQCNATRGLSVSRDDTSITSAAACIGALGPSYLPNPLSPRPLRANAVFSLDHSNVYKSLPARVTVSGVHIIVPAATKMDGVSVFGGEVSLDHITVAGAPVNDVLIGAARLGSG